MRRMTRPWLPACLLAASSAATAQQAFVRGADGALWTHDGGWRSLGGVLASAPDACATPDGTLHVVSLAPGGAAELRAAAGGSWSEAASLGGAFDADPALACVRTGEVHVIAREASTGLVRRSVRRLAAPDTWEVLGGPVPGGIDAAADAEGNVAVVARGMDGMAWLVWPAPSTGPARALGGPIQGDPSIAALPDGRFALVARGMDGALWRTIIPASGPAPFERSDFAVGDSPDLAVLADGRLAVAATDASGSPVLLTLTAEGDVASRPLEGVAGSALALASIPPRRLPQPTSPVLSAPAGAPGALVPLPLPIPIVTPRLDSAPQSPSVPARTRYRVTLNGLWIVAETWDDALNRDGQHDEVFIVSRSLLGSADGEEAGNEVRTPVMGDVNRNDWRTTRIQAGSASGLGGLVTGDRIPSPTPWERSGPPTRDRLPLQLWEGEIGAGDKLVVVPTIWEWDDSADLLNQFLNAFVVPVRFLDSALGNLISPAGGRPDPRLNDVLRKARPEAGSPVLGHSLAGDPKDRPVGMHADGEVFRFAPTCLVLSAETAARTARTDFGHGPGIVAMPFDDDAFLRGRYVAYLQVEKLN